MAIALTLTRPLATQTAAENASITAVAIEAAGNTDYALDFKATINAAARLLGRVRVTPEASGKMMRFKVEFLDFSSTADQTYADARTTPFTDAEADNAAAPNLVGYSEWFNADAIYTTAGDNAGA